MNTRLLYLLLVPVLLFSCATEPEEVQGTIDTSARIAEDTQPRPGTSTPTSDDYLLLRLGSATASAGDHVCLPVVAENFRDIIGLQYTITWDSTQLEFDKVSNFKLPGLREDGFGTRFTSAGYLSSLWTEAALQGTSLANGTALYEVCFT
ncbi:MAG: cohesin domain-containing protein, partial [Saprospiraceae bacterium]